MSLFGALRPLLIPTDIGFDDPREVGRALIAWKYGLTPEQVRTLELVVQGLTNAAMAQELQLKEEQSVKNRLKTLMDRIGADNRLMLASIAARFGLTR